MRSHHLSSYPITILGAGSYGTALAIEFSRSGFPIYLWGHNAEHLASLKKNRQNIKYLENFTFPESLIIEENLKKAIESSQDILICVPSYAFKELLLKIKPLLHKDQRIVWATKGLEPKTGRLLQDVVLEILGTTYPIGVLSGPSFAKEIAAGLPTAITFASNDEKFALEFQSRIHSSKNFRVYLNHDLIGVQIGGAIKNIIAIATGISDGIGFGANARTALITRGLVEISRLGSAMGAKESTFMGMAGLGDLILTCTDNQSRNRHFGYLLGQGFSIEQAMNTIEQAIEGYRNTNETRLLAKHYNIEMPITEQVYQVVFKQKSPHEAALSLLGREKKKEIISNT